MSKARKAKAAIRKTASTAKNAVRQRRSAEAMLAELKSRLREISDLRSAGAVLSWDQATYMPEGGADARGRQGAVLYRLAHERAVAPALGKLLDALEPYGEGLPSDSDDASLIRVAGREYQKAVKVPADFVARANAHGAASYDAWTRARPANDFAAMVPYLEKTLDLSREYSSFFAPYKHVADPHIDDADEGMTTASIRKMFGELRRELVPIVDAICDQPAADDSCLRQMFPKQAQFDFALHAATCLGYDVKRGRLDLTHHPFCTQFSAGDIRITTRVNESDLGDALFSTLHESGHAMYEQGIELVARRHAARTRSLGRRARKPVAAVGERRRAQPRLLATLLSASAAGLSGSIGGGSAAGVPSRHQQGRAIAHPHRCGRGHL